MSSSGFTNKWIQSSRGLPGSFMNENHHTMTHVWKGDDNRQKHMAAENQTSSNPTYMSREQKHDHQIQQSNEMGDSDLLGQEPQRSILGPHNDEFQSQQTNFPDDGEFYSRPKKNQHPPPITAMFPQEHLAGGLYKIDQDPPPHTHKSANNSNDVTELGNDPDPATKAAFQSTTRPIMTTNQNSEPNSVSTSFGSNRAIKNQPLVSDPIHDYEYDDDGDYYTTSELMPATYVENNETKFQTPTNASSQGQVADASTTGKNDMVSKHASDENEITTQDMASTNMGDMDDGTRKKEKMAPLRASDMYHQQQEQNISPSNANTTKDTKVSDIMDANKDPMNGELPVGTNDQEQHELSSSSLRGDNTIQNSLGGIGDKYKNQEPTKQPQEPFAQGGITTNANDENNPQQMPKNDTRYPDDPIPNQQNQPTLSQPNDTNPFNKAEGRRRSSLTQSIGKLFGRHRKD